MTEHSKYQADGMRDLDVSASEAVDVRGGRPMDDEIEFVGDSEQPNPSGPGSTGPSGIASVVGRTPLPIPGEVEAAVDVFKKLPRY